jgi:hypothetical protein
MSSQSYSSLGTGIKRRGVLHDDIDRSVYTVGQTLASIVNDPRTAHQTGGGFWGLGHDPSQAPQPPPLDPAKYPPVSKADLQQYMNLVHGSSGRCWDWLLCSWEGVKFSQLRQLRRLINCKECSSSVTCQCICRHTVLERCPLPTSSSTAPCSQQQLESKSVVYEACVAYMACSAVVAC